MKAVGTRQILLGIYLVLSVLLLQVLSQKANLTVLEVFKNHPSSLGLLLACQFAYILAKSGAWTLAWRSQGIPISLGRSAQIQLISSFIDCVAFPSGVTSDTFKFAHIRGVSSRAKIRAIALCRVCSLLPVLVATWIYLAQRTSAAFGWIVGAGIAGALLLARARFLSGKLPWGAVAGILLCTMCSFLADGVRAYVLVSMYSAQVPASFILQFGICSLLGYLTALPMGLGFKDLGYWYFLSPLMQGAEIGAFLVLLRLTGELLSAFLGWVVAGRQLSNQTFSFDASEKLQ